MGPFVAEAHLDHGAEVLVLVPVAANTSHWKLCVWGVATGVVFLYDTRSKFLVDGRECGKRAPMSCALVYWRPRLEWFYRTSVDVRHCREVIPDKEGQLALILG